MTFVTIISLSGSGKRRQLWFLVCILGSYDSLYSWHPNLGSAEPEIRPAKCLPLHDNPDYERPFTGVIFDLSPDRVTMCDSGADGDFAGSALGKMEG